MADDAIHWLKQLNDINPSLPFLLYYVPGGTHAPHHPTPEWIKKATDLHLFDIGADTGTPVDDRDYQVPFGFTGAINKLTIALDPPKLTPGDVQKLEGAYRAAQDAN